MDFLKSTKRGPFGSAGGRIPEGKGGARPPPNPPLVVHNVGKYHMNNAEALSKDLAVGPTRILNVLNFENNFTSYHHRRPTDLPSQCLRNT